MREGDVITAIGQIKFFEVARIRNISIEHIAKLIASLPCQGRTLKPGLLPFNDVSLDSSIPVIIRRIIETDIAHIVTLHLVTTELRSQNTGLTATLERGHNHRKYRHRHIGDIQDHRARRDGFLGFNHHPSPVEIEMLVSRVVTSAKVATSNLDTLIRQTPDLHTVQLLVVLIRGRIVYFANAAIHIVL